MTFENTTKAHLEQKAGVPYLSFPVLSQFSFLKHGFSTRLGGVSSGVLSSMNFGSDSGPYQDSAENVQENYRRMAEALGVEVHSMVISKQVHKTNIRRVTKEDCGKGLFRPRDYDEIDGLITNQPNITLVTKYADCVPLYFVDPVKKAIGLTHSGWRGTVAGIGRLTVEEMRDAYDCRPEDIIAVIGPSICRKCFEIGEDVATEFEKAFPQNTKDILFPLTHHPIRIRLIILLYHRIKNIIVIYGVPIGLSFFRQDSARPIFISAEFVPAAIMSFYSLIAKPRENAAVWQPSCHYANRV
jgi:YfiH family protein